MDCLHFPDRPKDCAAPFSAEAGEVLADVLFLDVPMGPVDLSAAAAVAVWVCAVPEISTAPRHTHPHCREAAEAHSTPAADPEYPPFPKDRPRTREPRLELGLLGASS